MAGGHRTKGVLIIGKTLDSAIFNESDIGSKSSNAISIARSRHCMRFKLSEGCSKSIVICFKTGIHLSASYFQQICRSLSWQTPSRLAFSYVPLYALPKRRFTSQYVHPGRYGCSISKAHEVPRRSALQLPHARRAYRRVGEPVV